MRYLELTEEIQPDGLMTYWDLVSHFKLEGATDRMRDATIPWINHNDWRRIDKLITNKNMRMASKLRLFVDLLGVTNMSTKFATPERFKKALSQPVTLYRGGGGVYDPEGSPRAWTSFTTNEKRVETFSKYDGTRAVRAFSLPMRDQYWIVKILLPLDRILLYLPHGSDDEVIISTEDAKHATVIEQSKTGMGGEPEPPKYPNRKNFGDDAGYREAVKHWASFAFNRVNGA